MSVLNDTWRYLVQRRLWPVAVLLLAALVAVPMVMAQDPEPAATPPAVATKSSQSSLATEPIVALAGPGDRAERRRVLGSRKNPFKPAVLPKPVKTPAAATAAPQQAATDKPSSGGGGGSTPGASVPNLGVTPQPDTTTPKKRYEMFELTVRFGPSTADTELPRSDLKRLEALPSADQPVLVYLGVLDDKKTAVFLVDSGVVAQGDGACKPSRTSCETIHLKAGETEFFDVVGEIGEPAAQFQLDLVKIRRKATTSAKQAKRSYTRASRAGKKIVRARIAGDGPLRFRYDEKSGRLHKLTSKAYKAALSRAATVARAHL
ncbi:MAG TPA: hypothetical protein VES79_08420 [Solirubrobacteraceae bacterium]|nr:hypothetical protein [Solirubrobacteraceae bacterium]